MSLDVFREALDGLDPGEYPEAARLAVMRLSDEGLFRHRLWAADDEVKRREAERAKAEGATDAVRNMRATVPALAPVEARIPESSPYAGMTGVLEYDPTKPFIDGDLVWASERVWQVSSAAPVSTPPGQGRGYVAVPPPVPEEAAGAVES
ncbi:hypothetical protein [Corynebacterium lujinxingii]|uniref:Uncharacterized protein n=1 Tax=Corynebacterium lujinxingii TaxID=2763010 RepID=A0A7H0JWL2_9CORY|nr:hypothetical protein [Corynebacterium lujinxingii]MBC3178933.1 hypothetical protein [Corynebacterium lujinxingii]NNO11214.1 hypothetical protein [Corynebacterium lujinxingii]QNP89428.1 hypothetical protein IAU68_06880 [Corynebacterium lujinxingii]